MKNQNKNSETLVEQSIHKLQYFIMLIIIILLLSHLTLTDCQFCKTPQRIGLLSFQALGNRDHLTTLFDRINKQQFKYNSTFVNNSVTYKITNFLPQQYYNDNFQLESYINQTTANVTGGILNIGYTFDYSVGNISGTAFGKVLVEPFYFQKVLEPENLTLAWKSYFIQILKLVRIMSIQSSTPKLPFEDKSQLQSMVNGYSGDLNIKEQMMKNLNRVYLSYLQEHLNNENIINTNNVTYSYNNNKIIFDNLLSSFGLRNDTFSGLQYQFLFELENYTTKCNQLPTTFNMSFGGVQEYLGTEFMKELALYALKQGWLNVKLDKSWDIEVFQFYIGDLANVMDKVQNLPANSEITGDCIWNNSLYDVDMSPHTNTEVYFNIPYTCTLKSGDTLLQRIHFSSSFSVQIILANQYMDTKVTYAGLLSPIFQSVGDYIITDQKLAGYYALQVIKSLINKKTLGSGFPATSRKYPVLTLTPQYIFMYDASQ